MAERILFVDDDPVLLNILAEVARKKLPPHYRVYTAEGGEAAVESANSQGPFSVVIVDMQMPDLNGIETISLLRKKLPNAVFVMLTGNKELDTAMQAVNDGKVFKFLTKPCEPRCIISTIEEAQSEHNSMVSAKDLLSGTFAGTLDLMTDLIEMPDGRHIDTTRMLESTSDLAKNLSIDLGWEERIAARICLVGLAILSPQESEEFNCLDPTSDKHKALFAKICKTSAGLLQKIPRLGWIVDLLCVVPRADKYRETGRRIEASALLLKVVFYWNFLTTKGLCIEAASSTIQKIMPGLSSNMIRAMEGLHDNQDTIRIKQVPVSDLLPGMIPYETISVDQDCKVITGGRHLTSQVIENLQRNLAFNDDSVAVVESSISAASYQAEAGILV
ncbi:response regulator [Rhodopirellula bahusiensis]|uniref:Response regulator receiver protein n=1 Tax=Rhodopirellula bahusiensis TaxID=2014065 RepID=A0A2G1W330_9BACT|nr:response regulator [Rhodopirellula bahusiensis]PHQ33395.1 response regulator receiver protein [Rhodopirellula bahusiensis]